MIQNEIARAGVLSFARFMELALYHPEHGYYQHSRIGKSGDFFTSVSVGPLFGRMLAFFLERKLANLEGPVQIVESGANDGALARDILSGLKAERVAYFIVEPIPALRIRQEQTLAHFPVRWVESLDELPPIRGAFISNELLDAFPVHVYRWSKSEWREYGVDANFRWLPMQKVDLPDLKPLEPYLPDPFTVEFSPAAESWWQTAAKKLDAGIMLAIDYGDESEALWSPARQNGTLRAYRNHKLVADPLANPGEQDLTASVNFTRIRQAGESAGLVSAPLKTQAAFLTEIAAQFLTNPVAAEVRQFQTLTHPEHLGRAFKVLLQSTAGSL